MNAYSVPDIGYRLENQPDYARSLPKIERNLLIVSAIKVDDTWVIKSTFADDIWAVTGGPTNLSRRRRLLDFRKIPPAFQTLAKEVIYRYMRRGREGFATPTACTIIHTFGSLLPFFRYLDGLGMKDLDRVTPIVCMNYVNVCRAMRRARKRGSTPLSANTLQDYFSGVEFLHELSHYCSMQMPVHPWPDSSSKHLAGRTGKRAISKTPLIPDDEFTALFQEAWTLVQRGDELLRIRDELDVLSAQHEGKSRVTRINAIRRNLQPQGWDSWRQFSMEITKLRTACYIVIASLSGCRNHELAYLKTGAYYCTEDESNEIYWWMRSQSDKTGAGRTEWMIPEAAVEALRVMEHWSRPLQIKLELQIERQRADNPFDPAITESQQHVGAIFLTTERKPRDLVRTQTIDGWNAALKDFAENRGISWDIATHHFRRKFANYAARSKFGDLRYLREHFKHWSQDMTNDSYALNESQEMELYAEIQNETNEIKLGLAEQWLDPAEPLAGGYGKKLVQWRARGENIALFKDHASMVRSVAESHSIRSNGHAWCTADDSGCVGNTFEKSRCGGCENAVIDRSHASLYQRIYADLQHVAKCDDIGPGGQARVLRDIDRCRDVLVSLGYDPEGEVV